VAAVGLEHVARAGNEHELGARDALGDEPAVRRRGEEIGVAVYHEGAGPDPRELVPHVVPHRRLELAEVALRLRRDARALDDVLLDALGMAVSRLVAVEEPRVPAVDRR